MNIHLLACLLVQQPAPPAPLQIGQCYYYHRTTGHGNEAVNPFWFRLTGRRGGTALMQAYTLEWQRRGPKDSAGQRSFESGIWSGRLRQRERKLARYSRCVPCSTLAELGKNLL